MDHLFWLTDVNGPRLTASPGFRSAADWAVRTLGSWGVARAAPRALGALRSRLDRPALELALVEPGYARLSGVPKAWSRGTSGRGHRGPRCGAALPRPRRPRRRARSRAARGPHPALRPGPARQAPRSLPAPRPRARPRAAEGPGRGSPRRQEARRAGGSSPEHAPLRSRWTWPLQRRLLEDRRRDVYDELWRFLAAEGVLGVLSTDDRGEGALSSRRARASGRPRGRCRLRPW